MLDKYEENAEGNYSLYGRTLEDDDMLVTYSLEQADRIVELQNLSMHEQNNTEEADQEDTNQELAEDIYGFGQETYAKVYGYNVKTGSYDLLFEDNDILDKKTLKTYIKEGKLQLKYVITENPDGLYGTIPKIIVKEEK